MLKELNNKSLGDLDDGRAGAVIDATIRQLVADLEDRGHDGKPRQLTIELTLLKAEGSVQMDVVVKGKLPAYRTASTKAKVRKRKIKDKVTDQLVFDDIAQDNPDQDTFRAMDDDGTGSAK